MANILYVYRPIATEGHSQELQQWTNAKFLSTTQSIGHSMTQTSYDNAMDRVDELVATHDFVIFRGIKYRGDCAHVIARAFLDAGKSVYDKRIADHVMNSRVSTRSVRPISKWDMYATMVGLGVLTPHTRQLPYEQVIRDSTYDGVPYIIKPSKGGRRGSNVYLINSSTKLDQVREHLMSQEFASGHPFLHQSYIENNGDYRAILIDGHCVALSKRKPKDLTRLELDRSEGKSKGVSTSLMWIWEGAGRYAKASGITFASADIVIDSGTNLPFVVEVNECPSVKTVTSRTKVNVVRQYLRYCVADSARRRLLDGGEINAD